MMRRVVSILAFTMLALGSAARAETIWVAHGSNQLSSFDSAAPATLTNTLTVSGLQGGESLLGIDFRPKTAALFALGSSGRLYTISLATGAATQVGTTTYALSGARFGFDFNPTVDRIRVVSDSGQNLRLHPDTGAVAATDTALGFNTSDPNLGDTPSVTGAGYTNNLAGVTTTTLYDFELGNNVLVTQAPPNDGKLNTVGALGVAPVDASVGFDISGQTGTAYAALDAGSGFGLYRVSLDVGGVRRLGTIGTPAVTGLVGLAIAVTEGTCIPSTTQLCLGGDRFAVTAAWRTAASSGAGLGIELAGDSGYFTFFNPKNTELVVKVLNACAGFGRYWVFVSGLTNVEVTLTVTDTKTGTTWTRVNPLGSSYAPILDTDAFATCP
jgi:hypothetical protein